MSGAAAELVLPARAALAEGPVWHPLEQALYWTDLERGELHRFEPAGGTDEVVHRGRTLGCFALREEGGFGLGTDEGIFRLTEDGAVQPVEPFLRDDPTRRINDGKVDRAGRFWFGSNTWDFRPGTGSLHVLDRGRFATPITALTLPNGLDWSPDGGTMYHADSMAEAIFAYDFDGADGALSGRRVFSSVPDRRDSPLGHTVFDGLTVDAEGNVWAAVYGLGEVRCHGPAGDLLAVVGIPTLAVTSVAFGGPRLETLFVTTGNPKSEDVPEAGALYALNPGVAGLPANFWID